MLKVRAAIQRHLDRLEEMADRDLIEFRRGITVCTWGVIVPCNNKE